MKIKLEEKKTGNTLIQRRNTDFEILIEGFQFAFLNLSLLISLFWSGYSTGSQREKKKESLSKQRLKNKEQKKIPI